MFHNKVLAEVKQNANARPATSVKWNILMSSLDSQKCQGNDVTDYVQVTEERAYRHSDEEQTSLQINTQTRTRSFSAQTSYIHMLHSLIVCVTTGVFFSFFFLFTLSKSKT